MTKDIIFHQSMAEISAEAWNELVPENEFLSSYAFLSAMEKHGCIGQKLGWLARPLALYEDNQLTALILLYEKHHNYGEFVFDHLWAEAMQQAGMPYYPKLVSTIPYTPAITTKLWTKDPKYLPFLFNALKKNVTESEWSSFHFLFLKSNELARYQEYDCCFRKDIQYHWHNQDYTDFNDFLSQLKHRKRKNILQERRRVKKAGVHIRVLNGHQATALDWQYFIHFYENTFYEKSGIPTFNLPFFIDIATQKPDNIVLVLADQNQHCIAGALMYISGDTLYGRHWGCIEEVNSLHFELCYYQGIEYCIQHGLQHFEPGAQGQHKMARGFIPTLTTSAHWIAETKFHHAISRWCEAESKAVIDYFHDLESHSPYHS